MFFVYILKSEKDSKLYIGYTNDIERRVIEHNSLTTKSTKSRAPFRLVYYEAYANQEEAKHREQNLKLRARALYQLKARIRKSIESPVWCGGKVVKI